MMLRIKLLILSTILSTGSVAKASYTYTFDRNVGDIHVSGAFIVDKLGVFGYPEDPVKGIPGPSITEWLLTFTYGGKSEKMGRLNGSLYVKDVVATEAALTFQFTSAANSGIMIYPDNTSSTEGQSFWGVGATGFFPWADYSEFALFAGDHYATGPRFSPSSNLAALSAAPAATSNVYVIATNPNATVVPEPLSWVMMIAGFGIAGVVCRRRRMAVRYI